MPLHSLYLDLNSFFASCEQQHNPALRGRPVAVVPLMTDSTCAIAASYEAKAFGIKTGTLISEAKRLCPDLVLVQASHKRYVEYHHCVLGAIERVMPVEKVRSIDELTCVLDKTERTAEAASKVAMKLKQIIREEAGICLTSSIGIAPNALLAKIASNMQKPDGLTLLTDDVLPHALHRLKLKDLPGIGPRMEQRLWRHGVFDVATLLTLDSLRMRGIWGGVGGARYHAQLHGMSYPDFPTTPSVIGHQHVLEPELRNPSGSLEVMRRLTAKAAERLRDKGYFCRCMSVHVKLTRQGGALEDTRRFHETQDTRQLLQLLETMWQQFPPFTPLRVGVTLSGLIPASAHQADLFDRPTPHKAMEAIDAINQRYGRGTITFGLNTKLDDKMKNDKIAFQRVPKLYEVTNG